MKADRPNQPVSRQAAQLMLTPVAFACLAQIAMAQDMSVTVPNEAAEVQNHLGTVEVKGIRAANVKTIAAKREATQLIDASSSDDIGALPDFNIGDAAKRITGVNTLTYQGEPRYLTIRGLDGNYNLTQIDGLSVASPDVGSRQMLMEMLPSNFVGRIEVVKTFTPDTAAGAIGGVMNLHSADAFSLPDRTLNISMKSGENLMPSQYGGKTPSADGSVQWARRFGDHNNIGLVLGGSYWMREIHVPQLETGGSLGWFGSNGKQVGSYRGTPTPSERRWYNYDNTRQRGGLTGRLDWIGDDDTEGHLSTFYFRQKEQSNRSMELASVNPNSQVLNQTETSGTLTSVNQLVELGQLRWDRALYGFTSGLKRRLDSEWTGEIKAGASRATVNNPQTWDRFTQSNMAFNYNWAGGNPVFTPTNAAAAGSPALYGLTYHRQEDTLYSSNVYDVHADVKRNMGEDDHGWGLALGLGFNGTHIDTSFSRNSWSGMPYNLGNVMSGSSLCGYACNSGLMMVNSGLASQLFNQYSSQATLTTDYASQYGGTYTVAEVQSSAYLAARYRTDRWTVLGGFRYEHTRDDLTGYQQLNGAWGPVASTGSYGNLLPSVVGFYDLSDDRRLRWGISQTLNRPRFDQIATLGGVVNTSTNPATISEGNPLLKPRKSSNFDLGHDWILENGKGIFSVAGYYKQISNEIFTWGAPGVANINGQPTNVMLTQPRNIATQIHLAGIEFGFTRDLEFLSKSLKGFGLSANATFNRVRYPITLTDGSTRSINSMPESPTQIWNLALYYERGAYHARVAWTHIGQLWDDRFPNFTPAGFYANRFLQATNNVDLQFGYDIEKNTVLTLDVMNLTGQGQTYRYGNSQEFQQSTWKLAPTVMVGFKHRFN